jgi:hypothetical protein
MADEKLFNGLAIFASSYVKRWMENNYDALMRTAPARKLMECGKPTRYGIEAALYALLAYGDQRWSGDTPLSKFVREVVRDAPSEISKRLVNGFREEVMACVTKGAPDQTKSVEQMLLGLDDAKLGALLAWLARTSPEDRARIRSLLGTLSDEELQRAARLAPADLDALENAPAMAAKPPSRLARSIGDELEQSHRRVDEKLAARRARRPS